MAAGYSHRFPGRFTAWNTRTLRAMWRQMATSRSTPTTRKYDAGAASAVGVAARASPVRVPALYWRADTRFITAATPPSSRDSSPPWPMPYMTPVSRPSRPFSRKRNPASRPVSSKMPAARMP